MQGSSRESDPARRAVCRTTLPPTAPPGTAGEGQDAAWPDALEGNTVPSTVVILAIREARQTPLLPSLGHTPLVAILRARARVRTGAVPPLQSSRSRAPWRHSSRQMWKAGRMHRQRLGKTRRPSQSLRNAPSTGRSVPPGLATWRRPCLSNFLASLPMMVTCADKQTERCDVSVASREKERGGGGRGDARPCPP